MAQAATLNTGGEHGMQKQIAELMERFGVEPALYQGGSLKVFTPVDGSEIAAVVEDTRESAEAKIAAAHDAFLAWRRIPAPKRGELIRLFGDVLRA